MTFNEEKNQFCFFFNLSESTESNFGYLSTDLYLMMACSRKYLRMFLRKKVVAILVIVVINVSNPESEARLLMIYFLELQITNGKRSD